MQAIRWIAYSALAGLLLGYGFVSLDVRGASADTPGNSTISASMADNGSPTVVAALPDAGATAKSYYATSPYYNPYYNQYAYYNPYYNPYANYYYNAAYNYCYAYYPTCQYYRSYYNIDSVYPTVYAVNCADPYYGTVWIAQSTASVVCY
jgi:hypothetical protein